MMVPRTTWPVRPASSLVAAVSSFLHRFAGSGSPAADTVVEQSETLYDAAGNRVQSTAWQRFHDATGTGPVGSPGSAGILPAARRTYACWWQDAIGREIAAADYGTNGERGERIPNNC